jgi:hypothetical protein
MPAWPRSISTFGVSLRTAAAEWKLRQTRTAPADQARALAALLPSLARAQRWRAAGLEARMDYAKFRAKVPLSTYAHLAPAIEQMRQGEADVLWPGRCQLFALSAGTTTGNPRAFPVTEEMLHHFRRAGMAALLYYTVRTKNAGVVRGRHLLLGGPTGLVPHGGAPGHEAYATGLTGLLELSLPAWVERHLYEPGGAVSKIALWDDRLAAITARAGSRDITLLAGVPNWVLSLARQIQDPPTSNTRPPAPVQNRWPNLECLFHTGIPITPFASELRSVLGPDVRFHETYVAAEGMIATQDTDFAAKGLRLMTNLGLFFEFLPMTEFDAARLDHLGAKALPVGEVKSDVDYAVIVTTPGGLVRTLLGDIVRFVSTTPPRLVFVGRTDFQLNAFGERVQEKELTDSLVAVCGRHNWIISNFHVAPLLGKGSLTGQVRGCHEWWIELQPGTVTTPKGPHLAAEVDRELQRLHPHYASRRRAGAIDEPTARLVMPGVFEHLLRHNGNWGDLHKLPRCRSDRAFADLLAQVTNFAQD